MQKLLAAAVAAFILPLAPAAYASQFTSTGVIETVNPYTNIIRIRSGDAYRLPPNIDLSDLRVGDRVHVDWNTQAVQTYTSGSSSREHVWLVEADSIAHAE